MATLPSEGDTNWGATLNAVIEEEHNSDGTHSDITADSLETTGKIDVGTFLSLPTANKLIISSGAITITHSYHVIDTEGEASTDNLDTINGGTDGVLLILRAANESRTVVIKNRTDNIFLAGTDFSLDSGSDALTLIKVGNNWVELSRSNNG